MKDNKIPRVHNGATEIRNSQITNRQQKYECVCRVCGETFYHETQHFDLCPEHLVESMFHKTTEDETD